MDLRQTSLPGVIEIHPSPHRDDRGHFARTYCADTFAAAGLEPVTAQMALSHNRLRGTLRGLHVIPEPIGEAKLVRCVRGSAFDVAVDLRPGSATFGRWTAVELSADNLVALYLPKGVAHGFLTREDATDIAYQFSAAHRPGVETGIRWDDRDIGIDWPFAPVVMSDRDRALPHLCDGAVG